MAGCTITKFYTCCVTNCVSRLEFQTTTCRPPTSFPGFSPTRPTEREVGNRAGRTEPRERGWQAGPWNGREASSPCTLPHFHTFLITQGKFRVSHFRYLENQYGQLFSFQLFPVLSPYHSYGKSGNCGENLDCKTVGFTLTPDLLFDCSPVLEYA